VNRTPADRVVDALTAAGLLEPGAEDRSRVVVTRALAGEEPATGSQRGLPKLVEVVAYLGASLVLAAAFLFLMQSWDDLGDVGQVLFMSTVTLVLGVAGWATVPRGAGVGGEVRRRLSGTLLTGSALAAGFTVGVAIEVFSDVDFHGVSWPTVAGGLVVTTGSVVAYRFSSTAVGLLGMLGGVFTAATNLASELAGDEALGVGLSVFALAVGWLLLTEIGLFEQQTIARALGVAVGLFGAQVASFTGDQAWVGYLASVVLAAAGVWLYLVRLAWPYVAGAVVVVTLVVPEAVGDWTDNSLGVVGGVLVAGITLLAASFAGYQLRKEATD
jgi:hypothetical protein